MCEYSPTVFSHLDIKLSMQQSRFQYSNHSFHHAGKERKLLQRRQLFFNAGNSFHQCRQLFQRNYNSKHITASINTVTLHASRSFNQQHITASCQCSLHGLHLMAWIFNHWSSTNLQQQNSRTHHGFNIYCAKEWSLPSKNYIDSLKSQHPLHSLKSQHPTL